MRHSAVHLLDLSARRLVSVTRPKYKKPPKLAVPAKIWNQIEMGNEAIRQGFPIQATTHFKTAKEMQKNLSPDLEHIRLSAYLATCSGFTNTELLLATQNRLSPIKIESNLKRAKGFYNKTKDTFQRSRESVPIEGLGVRLDELTIRATRIRLDSSPEEEIDPETASALLQEFQALETELLAISDGGNEAKTYQLSYNLKSWIEFFHACTQ
ncbi:hypothetical protein BJ875DRAFT_27094 [Amylocarpus encephaloides]|uniref:Uncharacterized protein n=1 Tax=Amylocarpus encephaloides TaxID=45428 RepID=A0A9P8C6H8_9HELO|nr:hypothetical protein BJ875DRAFT_27094 [Amylocarpus encephaloides]